MRVIWGILAILVFVSATFDVASSCVGDHSRFEKATVTADHGVSSDAQTNTVPHDCPVGCHHNGSHCHSSCFQHFSAQTIDITIGEIKNLAIFGEFQAPLAPDLEGNRKPPKVS